MRRILDTNIFLSAHRRHYPIEVCPGYWDWLSQSFEGKKTISVEKVYKEILEGKDPECPVKKWAKEHKEYFLPSDGAIEAVAGEIVRYVTCKYKRNPERTRFIDKADPFIIAAAKINQEIVVTDEKRNDNIPPWNKVKIPNVCEKFGVEYEVNIFSFMKKEKVQLILG